MLRINKCIYGFLGSLQSRIIYDIVPDRNRPTTTTSDSDVENDKSVTVPVGLDWITGIGDITGEWPAMNSSVLACPHFRRAGAGRRNARVEDLF